MTVREELSLGMQSLYAIHVTNPVPLVTITPQGVVRVDWDEISKAAAKYVPGAYNDVTTSWAYVLQKLKDQSNETIK